MRKSDENRAASLTRKMADKGYRSAYTESHCRQMLARQMRGLRGSRTRAEFAVILGMTPAMVARLESPLYRGWSLRLIFRIAERLDIAAFVRFMDFGQFIRASEPMGPTVVRPRAWPRGVRKGSGDA